MNKIIEIITAISVLAIILFMGVIVYFITDLWSDMNKERKQELIKCRIENDNNSNKKI